MGAYIGHEFLADWPDLAAQGGTEHHDLLVMGGQLEDGLHVGPHVCTQQGSSVH